MIFELEKARTMNDEQKPEAAPATHSGWWSILILVAVLLAAATFMIQQFLYFHGDMRSRHQGLKFNCISNLRQIDGAKEVWALDNKKVASDTPTDSDLIGTDKYIKVKPTCPLHGIYSYNNMATTPTCNARSGDHVLP